MFGVILDTEGGEMIRERIATLLNENGWTLSELSKRSGLSIDTIKNITSGKITDPRLTTLVALSDAFNISINCLIGKCPHTPAEKAILRNYRSCGKHGKAIIELIARYEAGATKEYRESLDKHTIPCLVPHGDIRKGIIYDTCETIDYITSNNEAYIGITMTNNDLAPKFCKDDVILFENRFPVDGEYAAFLRGDRVYIRKFIEEDGHYRLKCLHNQGEDIVLKRMDEVQYIGACAGVDRA